MTENEGYSNDDEVVNEVSQCSKQSCEYETQVYTRRWVILSISCTAIFLRGFNQSCYGPINSVFVRYLDVRPWQVDWFILTQSVVFLSMSLPLSWATSRLGFRNSYIIMTASLMLGFALTTAGCSTRAGFIAIIAGQTIMGFSNIISWSIPPPTAALWFPSNEVATAVALQVVGRGVGESVGSILTPALVSTSMPVVEIGSRLTIMFIAFTLLALLLTIAVLLAVKDAPPLPPSVAQANAKQKNMNSNLRDQNFKDALKDYKCVIKELFMNKYFVAVWFAFAAVNPVLRNNSVLLSSILKTTFANNTSLNKKAGLVLMGGWITYTIGGFIAGPIITRTKKFREIVFYSIFFECLSCVVILIGIRLRLLECVYAGVVVLGLFLGMANTSLFELLVEVTYPKPTMLVTMVNIIGMGIFRLIYPIIGREMLTYIGPTASTGFPVAMTAVAAIVIGIIRPPYLRLNACNQVSEDTALLEKDDDSVE